MFLEVAALLRRGLSIRVFGRVGFAGVLHVRIPPEAPGSIERASAGLEGV